MKLAFMYAGQGAQHIGMGTDIYEKYSEYRNIIDSIGAGDGSYIKSLMDNGPAHILLETENTQPVMAVFAIGVTEILKNKDIIPNMACGLSIGEYGALYAAGVFDAKGYLDIVSYRGKVMAEAASTLNCCMSAIIGLAREYVEKAVRDASIYGYIVISNYNCIGQYVICGDEEAVSSCEELCKSAGAKQCIRLNVSGPFHTKYMNTAAKKLRIKLDEYLLTAPKLPILLNVTGEYFSLNMNLKDVLENQIRFSVRFEDEIIKMLEDGIDTFVEIGPGKALSGFVKRTAKAMDVKVDTHSIDSSEDIEKCLNALCVG